MNPQASPTAHSVASETRNEYVLQVKGTVEGRRPGTENKNLPTGAIEVSAAEVSVLNAAKTPPFYINEDSPVDEMLRLRPGLPHARSRVGGVRGRTRPGSLRRRLPKTSSLLSSRCAVRSRSRRTCTLYEPRASVYVPRLTVPAPG